MDFDLEGAKKAGYSDAEIADYLAPQVGFDVEGARKAGYADTDILTYLFPKPVEGGFKASAKQIIGSTIKGAGQAAADFIPGVDQDNALKRYGQEVVDANPTAVHGFQDIADRPLTTVTEATGNAAGSMAGMVGARLVGQGITAASPLAGPLAPAVAAVGQAISWLGPVAIAALPSFGGIRDKQILNDPENQESAKSKAVAALGAAAVGAIETRFGPQNWALAALTKEGRAKLAEKFAATTLTGSVAKAGVTGAAVEGAEELVQNPIEQIAAGDDPTTREALTETAFGGAMGAVGGGVLGGGFGLISSAQSVPSPLNPPGSPPPQSTPFAQAAAEEEQQTAAGIQAIESATDIEGITQAAIAATSQPVGPNPFDAIDQAANRARDEVRQGIIDSARQTQIDTTPSDEQFTSNAAADPRSATINAQVQGGLRQPSVPDAELSEFIQSEARDKNAILAEQQVAQTRSAELDAIQSGDAPNNPPVGDIGIAMQKAQQARAEQDRLALESQQSEAEKARRAKLAPQPADLPILQRMLKREPVTDAEARPLLAKGFIGTRPDGTYKVIEKGLKARNLLLRQAAVHKMGTIAPNLGMVAPEAGSDIPNVGSQLPNLGTEAGNDNIAPVIEQKPVIQPTTVAEQPIPPPSETITPKVVGGIPVSAQSDEQSQAIPATNPTIVAQSPEIAPTPSTIAPNNVSQTVQNEPIRAANEAKPRPVFGPDYEFEARNRAALKAEKDAQAVTAAAQSVSAVETPVQKPPAFTPTEQTVKPNANLSNSRGLEVAPESKGATVKESLTPEAERFQGQYKKGMSERVARQQQTRLTKEQHNLVWTVEKSTIPEFPDRFDVVGRKPTAQASTQPPKVASPELERRPAPTPREAPTAAQPATPAESTDKAEIATQAPASQAEPAKARVAEIDAELAKLQAQYEKKSAGGKLGGMVPPAVKASALKSITDKMDKLDAEKAKLLKAAAPTKPAAEPAPAPETGIPVSAVMVEPEKTSAAPAAEKAPIAAESAASPIAAAVTALQGAVADLARAVNPEAAAKPVASEYSESATPAPESAAKRSEAATAPIASEKEGGIADKNIEAEAPIARPEELDFQRAKDAHRGTSMVPDDRARTVQREFADDVNSLYDGLLESAKTDQQKSVLRSEVERYKAGYLAHMYSLLGAQSRTMSGMIAGPSNFPVARNQKRLDSAQRRLEEFLDWRKKARGAVVRAVSESRSSEQVADDAWAGLKKDIDRNIGVVKGIDAGTEIYDRHAFTNSVSGKLKRMADNGETDLVRRALDYIKERQSGMEKPLFAERNSVWALAEKAQASAEQETPTGTETVAEYQGASIVDNKDEQRVQITFDTIPGPDLRNALKAQGWRWSPSNKAWQRQNTNAAIASAKQIVGAAFETRDTDKGTALYSRNKPSKGALNIETAPATPAIEELNAAVEKKEGITNAFLSAKFNDEGLANAYKSAFGVEVVYVSPTSEAASQFLGIHYGGKIYVNPDNPHHGFIQLAGHELLHQLRRDRQDLYNFLAAKAESYRVPGAAERYSKRLESVGGTGFDVQEETLADFTGDALADPNFLKALAENNPSKFRQLLTVVVSWLKRVATKLYGKGFRSSEYFTDVNALKDYLAAVLSAYSEQKTQSVIDGVEPPSFSRAQDQNVEIIGRLKLSENGSDAFILDNEPSTGTTDTVTPEMRQRGLALRARITELIGDRPDVKVKTFLATPESPLGSYSKTPFGSVITMALNAKDELSIADHEGYHAAEDLILSDTEQAIIGRAMKPGRPLYQRLRQAALAYDKANGTSIADEIKGKPVEARAYGFEFYRRGALKADGIIGRIYQKLQRFFESVQNAIDGLGFTSAEDVFDALDQGRLAGRERNAEAADELQMEPQFAIRIVKASNRTARDFIVPETPEYDGNMSGDLATIPESAKKAGLEPLPIRLSVGVSRGPHLGYGILHMKDNADNEGFREPPQTTNDRAENFARHVVEVLKDSTHVYSDAADRLIFRSQKMREAVVVARKEDNQGPYYSIITVRPSAQPTWGNPVWMGRLTFPNIGQQQSVAPGAVVGQNSATANLDRAGVQTESYDFTTKQPTVQYKGRKIDRDQQFSRAAVQGGVGQGAVSGSWVAPEAARLDSLIYTLQDKQVDTRRVLQAIRTAGKKIADALDVYLQEELFHGRAAKKTQLFVDDELKPLITEMAARNVTMPEFEEYLHARHAEEANIAIAARNPDMPDGGSGMDTADAQAYLGTLDPAKKRAFEALAKRVDAINDATRQLLVDYELESQGTIDTWKASYKNYVPLHREDMGGGPGIGQGFSVRGPASKMRTGSNRTVVDILGNIAMQREKTIVRGEKNVVSTALYGLAKANPNADFWTLAKPGIKTSISAETGDPVDVVDMSYQGRDNVVMSRSLDKDGKIVQHGVEFNVHNERALRMALALKNLDTNEMGEILSASAKATRYFASINTQYNPIFGVVNLTRDSQQAMFNLSTTPISGKQAEVAKHTLSALKGIYSDLRAERSGQHPSSAWAQLFEEFQKEGGQTGYRDMFRTGKDRAEAIERELARAGEGKIKQFGRAVFDWLSDYNSAMENAVRLAAYKVGKESGMTNQRAASMAKNLTVNFNRKGQIGTQAGALYAFFNASVQGSARLAETLTGPLGRKIVLGGITLGAIQALMLAAAGFDDDEPPQFVRERSTIIPIGGKKYITIPMPLGLHFIPNIGRIGTEFALSGFKNPGKRVMDLVNVFADAFNPVGAAGLSLQTIAPTVIDPFAALAENKDWTGKPIMREDMSQLSPTPGHTRAKDTASYFSKAVSKALNYASGGTAYKPGLFSPTPDAIDYLIGQAAGGVGREAMKVEQSIGSVFSGQELPTYKIPLVGRFYGNAEQQSSQGNAFYSNLKAINEHEAEIKGRRKAGEPLGDYVKENPEARLIQLANATERQVSLQRKRKRELIAKDADKEAIKAVDLQITAKMKAFNDRVKQVSASAQ